MNETNRLLALQSYNVLDTPPDSAFDRITEMMAYCFRTPIALISLVDADRIWFKSKQGLSVSQIARVPGLCASAMLCDKVYVVNDAVTDSRTLANPLVTGELGLRFYAAAPLITHDGYRLGTVNVIDLSPREFSAGDENLLQQFAAVAMNQMELRLSARKTIESLARVLCGIKHPGELEKIMTVCAWTKKVKIAGKWMTFDEFLVNELGLALTHGCAPEAEAALYQSFGLGPEDMPARK